MKTVTRWIALVTVAGLLAATTAFAGDCCTKTTDSVKQGKACAKCVEGDCCKKTAEEVAKKGEAKTCEKCAAKADKKA